MILLSRNKNKGWYFYEVGASDLSPTEVRAVSFEFGVITLIKANRDDFDYREYTTKELYDLITSDIYMVEEYNLTDTFKNILYNRDLNLEGTDRYQERLVYKTIRALL